MRNMDLEKKKLSQTIAESHRDEVNRIKTTHHESLSKKIADIQSQLSDVMELSKTYWDQHADKHGDTIINHQT